MTTTAVDDQYAPDRDAAIERLAKDVAPEEWAGMSAMHVGHHRITWGEYQLAREGRSKYHREIKPGVWVDVYDVLQAWRVQNPALQHLLKKALQAGERGYKSRQQDLDDILASAKRARELDK